MMNRLLQLLILAAFVFVLIGCGSPTKDPVVKKGDAANSNVTASAENAGANANEQVAIDANSQTPHPKSIAGRANRPQSVDAGPMPDLKPRFTDAPENSESSASMNSKGQVTETRIFKQHPKLVKAEAVWLNGTDKEVTITLKDGRKVTKRTSKIENLKVASSDYLLELAGVTSGPERPGAAPSDGIKR